MKPALDTQRTVDWSELPPAAKEVRDDLNLADQGLLMSHQKDWISIKAKIKLCEKGRRTGITFAEALDSTITAASRQSSGGSNVYYMADTREKGLEFVGYCAKFAKLMARAQSASHSDIEQFLFEDQDSEGKTKHITAYRIRFSSGHQIVGLASRPENIHGLQGRVVIDEAALHADVGAVLESATALLIWGGTIHIISTHRGKSNPFNQLKKDIDNGQYGNKAKVYRVTFDEAVANGLYERTCYMQNKKPTAAGKKEWYNDIRNAYGPRKSAMREELDAIPRDGSGVAIPGIWVENAMPEQRPVLRWALPDDFASKPELERKGIAEHWIKRHLNPVLNTLNSSVQHVFGMDFARHRHFTIIVPAYLSPLLKRMVPFVLELHNVPTRQQEQILWATIAGLPNFRAGAMDATGPGQTIAEYTADKFGKHRIHQVNLSRKWYADNMRAYVDAFEDGAIELPKDISLQEDHRAVELVDGIPMIPKLEKKDLKEPDLIRHGDSAIAGALMWFASLNRAAPIEFQSITKKSSRWNQHSHDDDNNEHFKGGAW